MLALVFWLALAWVAYAYAGYAVVLGILGWLRPRPILRRDVVLDVSIIVATHNGARSIREKLENVLDQDYPKDRMEIVVADDCSDDGTDRIILEEFGGRGVRLVRLATRGGKESAQKAALLTCRGEILVFTDVGTRLDRHGVRTLLRSFASPEIGAVSSEDRFVRNEGGTTGGEDSYIGYLMRLRRLESRVGSVVGLSGSLFAVRREICSDFSDRLTSDFRTALRTVRQGMRAVADDEAIGYYRDIARGTREFDRKVRTVVRGLTVFFEDRALLNPFRYGLFSWQLVSHKLARWTVPFALIAALCASAALASRSRFFAIALMLQLAGYALAAAAMRTPRLAAHAPLRALAYVLEANLALLFAWVRFLRGDRIVVWSPSTR